MRLREGRVVPDIFHSPQSAVDAYSLLFADWENTGAQLPCVTGRGQQGSSSRMTSRLTPYLDLDSVLVFSVVQKFVSLPPFHFCRTSTRRSARILRLKGDAFVAKLARSAGRSYISSRRQGELWLYFGKVSRSQWQLVRGSISETVISADERGAATSSVYYTPGFIFPQV